MCAFWLAFVLLNHGDLARGGGWIHRAERLLDSVGIDCVEEGYVVYAAALRRVFQGDPAGAEAGFSNAASFGDRFGNRELAALARVGHGRCLIHTGDIPGGMTLLDEAMATVSPAVVSPGAMGDLYCTVIDGCQEAFDVRRAQEWTEALSRWCERPARAGPLPGPMSDPSSRAHASVGIVAAGAPRGATCLRPPLPAPKRTRSRGRILRPGRVAPVARRGTRGRGGLPAGAHLGTRAATRAGGAAARPGPRCGSLCRPPPRSSRSRCRSGGACTTAGAIRQRRAGPGAIEAARSGADELSTIAGSWDSPYLGAVSAYATGSVLLAEGDPAQALTHLRRARAAWVELEVAYEAARTRILIGRACRDLGDSATADLELDAAHSELTRLGAAQDAAPVRSRVRGDGLTTRELEVLRRWRPERRTGPSHRGCSYGEDRRHARQQHPAQTRGRIPGRGDGLRVPASPAVGLPGTPVSRPCATGPAAPSGV